jgi:hypothetical protein
MTSGPLKVTASRNSLPLYHTLVRGFPLQTVGSWANASEHALLLSKGNPFPYRSGGTFLASHRSVQHYPHYAESRSTGVYAYADSYFLVNKASSLPALVVDPGAFIAGLVAQGAVGWNKFRPTASGASVFVALKEIRNDGLPSLPLLKQNWANQLKQGHGLRLGSEEYLNYMFGWVPLISDLKKIHRATLNSHRFIQQYIRGSGAATRRKGTISINKTVSQSVQLNAAPLGNPLLITTDPNFGNGFIETTTTSETKYWFSGRFRFYIPKILPAWAWKDYAVAKLYGVLPDPQALWEATPWSWLVDYWFNMDSVLGNISSSILDGLVADYAYCMGSQSSKIDHTHTYWTKGIDGGSSKNQSRLILESNVNSRIPASPFGFGLTSASLSSRQAGILAALGINRVF